MTWRFVGANFDQMHLNTNLQWVVDHPDAELVGVCDEEPDTSTGSLADAVEMFDIPQTRVYADLDRCLTETDPHIVLGAPRNSLHAEFVERVAEYGVHVAIEKPFAHTLDDADRMLAAVDENQLFVVNWPVTWEADKHTVKQLVADGTIGDPFEIQYYGGNAGAPPDDSWFYDPDAGGGSLMDYLGYGATFSTWFRGGELPTAVTTEAYTPPELDVDVQSTSICHFQDGLSTLQTSWRMFTHPWEHQPHPPKGFELVGPDGTISTRTPGSAIHVQTNEDPAGYPVDPDPLPEKYTNLVYYLLHCLEADEDPTGPADPAFCRSAQRIIETAKRSVDQGGAIDLLD